MGAVRPGPAIVTIDRWTLAEELWSFGEDVLYLAPLEMPDEELIRVWALAGEILASGEARSGRQAAAMATVALVEREPRPLTRSRRRPQSQRTAFSQTPEQRLADVHRIERKASFPHAWS